MEADQLNLLLSGLKSHCSRNLNRVTFDNFDRPVFAWQSYDKRIAEAQCRYYSALLRLKRAITELQSAIDYADKYKTLLNEAVMGK